MLKETHFEIKPEAIKRAVLGATVDMLYIQNGINPYNDAQLEDYAGQIEQDWQEIIDSTPESQHNAMLFIKEVKMPKVDEQNGGVEPPKESRAAKTHFEYVRDPIAQELLRKVLESRTEEKTEMPYVVMDMAKELGVTLSDLNTPENIISLDKVVKDLLEGTLEIGKIQANNLQMAA